MIQARETPSPQNREDEHTLFMYPQLSKSWGPKLPICALYCKIWMGGCVHQLLRAAKWVVHLPLWPIHSPTVSPSRSNTCWAKPMKMRALSRGGFPDPVKTLIESYPSASSLPFRAMLIVFSYAVPARPTVIYLLSLCNQIAIPLAQLVAALFSGGNALLLRTLVEKPWPM